MIGDLRVVEDVAGEFAAIVRSELVSAVSSGRRNSDIPFRLGCSGGGSGTKCFERLRDQADLPWSSLAFYFVDERCVDPTSSEANQKSIADALGERREALAGYYPMDCSKGPDDYDHLLRAAGPLDLIQLGFGPDGHTASLFPQSMKLNAAPERLVVSNIDPSGNNVHERLSLTFSAIAMAPLVVVTVMGKEKATALANLVAGADLPAAHVRADRVIWLCDPEASASVVPNLAG